MFPFIHIFGRDISSYGVCLIAAVMCCAFLAWRKGRSQGLLFEDLAIVGAFAVGLGMFGGSLLYVIVSYTPAQIAAFIKAGNFVFLGSGIVFYGGLIGGICGALLGIKVAGCRFDTVVRTVVPFVPLGHAIGRVGCVLAGCCHGFAYEGPFAIYYPDSVLGLSPEQGYFPVQILESVINVGLCCILLWYEKRTKRAKNVMFAYIGAYAACRFVLELLRGDEGRGIYFTFSTSQIISIVLLSISTIGLLRENRITKK